MNRKQHAARHTQYKPHQDPSISASAAMAGSFLKVDGLFIAAGDSAALGVERRSRIAVPMLRRVLSFCFAIAQPTGAADERHPSDQPFCQNSIGQRLRQ